MDVPRLALRWPRAKCALPELDRSLAALAKILPGPDPRPISSRINTSHHRLSTLLRVPHTPARGAGDCGHTDNPSLLTLLITPYTRPEPAAWPFISIGFDIGLPQCFVNQDEANITNTSPK